MSNKRKAPTSVYIVAVIALVGLVWVNLTLYPNAGNLLGTLLFGGILCIVVFRKKLWKLLKRLWKRVITRIAVCVLGAFIAAGAALCVFFSVNMVVYSHKPLEDIDCVIVLGCQVQGETPGNMLQDRLNAALELLKDNSDAVCIVSGGQGAREDITEAEAMRRYFVNNGIADNRIYCEQSSTSTEENLRFSAEILSQLGIENNIAIVTNEFHQYRADICAKRLGLSVGHYSAGTSLRLLPNYWIREWGALAVTLMS